MLDYNNFGPKNILEFDTFYKHLICNILTFKVKKPLKLRLMLPIKLLVQNQQRKA